jgi:hypothetical protein
VALTGASKRTRDLLRLVLLGVRSFRESTLGSTSQNHCWTLRTRQGSRRQRRPRPSRLYLFDRREALTVSAQAPLKKTMHAHEYTRTHGHARAMFLWPPPLLFLSISRTPRSPPHARTHTTQHNARAHPTRYPNQSHRQAERSQRARCLPFERLASTLSYREVSSSHTSFTTVTSCASTRVGFL